MTSSKSEHQRLAAKSLATKGHRANPMDSEAGRRIAATVMRKSGADANAEQVAIAIVVMSREIDTALIPIIGRQGVGALYKRSFHLSGATHSWLTEMNEHGVDAVMDRAVLQALIARQGSADAAAGGTAVLQTLHDLLTSLVGASLTDKLLRSVWDNTSGRSPGEDTTS